MNESKNFSRRDFLQLSALGAAGAALSLAGCATDKSCCGPDGSCSTPGSAKIPIGLQLYSVRNDCKADFAGTLQKVAKIGYKGVEFAGYFGVSAKDIRKMLDDNGLVACGSHTPSEDVQASKLESTIEFNETLGNHFIIVPDMTGKTRNEWLDKCKYFNEVAAKLHPKKMFVGYHSHWHDFHQVEGEMPWDIFGENTSREVIMQLDTSNCVDGGGDPMTELKKFPGRTRSIHIKPNGAGPESIIGEDKLDWSAIFQYCETKGGTKWYVVEHETSKNPLDAVARTFEKLKTLGKV